MELEVRQASFSHVNALAQAMRLPVYWPNVALPGSPADVHLRVAIMPASPAIIKTSGRARFRWVLQVSVYVRDGIGEIKPSDHANSLREGIPYGTILTGGSHTFRVIDRGTAAPSVFSDAWVFIPVQFKLQTFD